MSLTESANQSEGGITMLMYSIIMFATAVLLITFSILIYKGNTNLIHDYHQTRVTDQKAYGKAFGKALSVVGLAPLLSGLIGLFGDSEAVIAIALSVFVAVFCAGLACIVSVQRKYNQGMF